MNNKNKRNDLPFANLPPVLKQGVEAFKTSYEQTIFLYSAIAILSGLCFRVKGEYRQQTVYPNLFLFILARFASGKSALNYAKKLVSKIHREITDHSLMLMQDYKESIKSKRDKVKYEKPPMRVVNIPANITGARLIEHLEANGDNTPSIMAEPEIDTLTNASKSEHGNFSDTLRKSFHNETISYSRKTDNEYLEVSCSKLAIALAGTFNQFRKLITNSEDGLFSRFLVYSSFASPKWSSVAPCNDCLNLDETFQELSNTVYEYYQYLKDNELEVQLTPKQWELVNQFGSKHLSSSMKAGSANSGGIVKRHGLMIYKFCMTLTAIRMAEQKAPVKVGVCTDNDFDLALQLCTQSLNNSLDLLASLPETQPERGKYSREEFEKKLPSEFERAFAIQVGKDIGLSIRSVDRYLEELAKKGVFVKVCQGKYKKP